MSKETSHNVKKCICARISKMDPIPYGSLMCASKYDGRNILTKSHFNKQNYSDGEFGPVEINTELPWIMCHHDGCESGSAGAIHVKHEGPCNVNKCVETMCKEHMPKATSNKIDDVYYSLQLPALQCITCPAAVHHSSDFWHNMEILEAKYITPPAYAHR